jgi:xanthine dehydrogenase YagT iron-sulfur-binding subunit
VEEDQRREESSGVSRRDFLKGVSTGIAATGLITAGVPGVGADAAEKGIIGPGPVSLTFKVNGRKRQVNVEPRHTLLEALRNQLDVTGPKPGCDRGSCGGCTVLLDGEPVYACMMLAVDVSGREVTTVEGIAQGDTLHPVQEAFIKHDALMCGFCTPGFVTSVKALLDRNPNPTLDDVKYAVAGNTCRCGTQPRIYEAAWAAARTQRGEG